MSRILTIAKKEFSDAINNKLFLILVGILFLLTATSIIVASYDFQNKVIEYNKSVAVLISLGKDSSQITAPQFFPLKMLRGFMDYMEITGAILAIVLGYLSIAKERGRNTLKLIFTRPLKKFDFFLGKLIGNSALLLSTLLLVGGLAYLISWLVGGAVLSASETAKFLLVLLFSFFYLLFFFCLAAILTLKSKSLPNALIFSFVIWLVFVLIIPQIGDTMDPDNQIPGGFFKTMNIDKPQEKAIMAKFSGYETVRNSIEISSVTKRYERLSFALLGIKQEYNGQQISYIISKEMMDLIALLSFMLFVLLGEMLILANKNQIILNE